MNILSPILRRAEVPLPYEETPYRIQGKIISRERPSVEEVTIVEGELTYESGDQTLEDVNERYLPEEIDEANIDVTLQKMSRLEWSQSLGLDYFNQLRSNVFQPFSELVILKDVESIIEFLKRWDYFNLDNSMWIYHVLDQADIFPQEQVNSLYQWFTKRRYLNEGDRLIEIPINLTFRVEEVFQELLMRVVGTDLPLLFERAEIAGKLINPDIFTRFFYLRLQEIQFDLPPDEQYGYPLRSILVERIVELSPMVERPSYLISETMIDQEAFWERVENITDGDPLSLRELTKSQVEYLAQNPLAIGELHLQKAVQTYRDHLESDILLTQVLGPANLIPNRDLTLSFKCTVFGGCRMFICDCLVDKSRDQASWFKSYCELCYRKIPEKTWALRIPPPSGGWIGCYCLDCAEKFVYENGLVYPWGAGFFPRKDIPLLNAFASKIQLQRLRQIKSLLETHGATERPIRDIYRSIARHSGGYETIF